MALTPEDVRAAARRAWSYPPKCGQSYFATAEADCAKEAFDLLQSGAVRPEDG